MKLIIEKKDRDLNLKIKGEYFVNTIADILNLAESKELKDYDNIIMNLLELELIDNCGSELYLLRSNFYKEGGDKFVVIIDNDNIKTIFNHLKAESEEEFDYVYSIEEVKNIIGDRI